MCGFYLVGESFNFMILYESSVDSNSVTVCLVEAVTHLLNVPGRNATRTARVCKVECILHMASRGLGATVRGMPSSYTAAL